MVLETTGLADPAPILHTLMGEPSVARNFALAGVACTIDACQAMATFDHSRESVKQAAVADLFLLTKTDLPQGRDTGALLARLRSINPVAVLNTDPAETLDALRALVETPANTVHAADDIDGGYRPFAWRAAGLPEAGAGAADVNRHDDRVRAFCITRDFPLSHDGFFAWLEIVSGMRGDDLLRVKGLVQLDDDPERPLVIHGVQHLFHPPERLPRWPSADRRSRIVFITRGLDAETIESTLLVYERRRRKTSA